MAQLATAMANVPMASKSFVSPRFHYILTDTNRCTGSSVGGQITSWINNNRNLVIGLAAGLGSLLLLATIGCLCSCCRRSKATRGRKLVSPPAYGAGNYVAQQPQMRGWQPTPPPMAHNGVWGLDGRWVPNETPAYSGRNMRYA